MKKITLTLIILFFASLVSGQVFTTKTSVYFKSNKYGLQAEDKKNIDTLITFLSDKEVISIFIQGNTDSDADSLYNIKLSQKRAWGVQNYLEEHTSSSYTFSTEFNGENIPAAPNDIKNGKQKNRRVDILVFYQIKSAVERKKQELENENISLPMTDTTMNKPNTIQAFVDTCKSDTTIFLPQGSCYTISVCNYESYKHSIKIVEYITDESISDSDFGTTTAGYAQLITGGMFDIQIPDSCKLDKPLTFRVPVSCDGVVRNSRCECNVNYRRMSLWSMNENGTWGNSQKIEIVKINDTLFYQFSVTRSVTLNLDYRMRWNNARNIKTTFKATGDVKLVSVRIFYQRSIFRKKGKDNIIQFKLPRCQTGQCSCIMIKAIGISASGDTLVSSKCMNDYKRSLMFGKCKSRGRFVYALGFIPVRPKAVYRRYIIKPKDWTVLE
jgi:hypothetical protein